jgi:hypothetical protein
MEAWFAAVGAGDADWFLEHLDPEFRYTTLNGEIWDRARLIEVDVSVQGVQLHVEQLTTTELAAGLVLVEGRYFARISDAGTVALDDGLLRALTAGLSLCWTGLWRLGADSRWRAFRHHVTAAGQTL